MGANVKKANDKKAIELERVKMLVGQPCKLLTSYVVMFAMFVSISTATIMKFSRMLICGAQRELERKVERRIIVVGVVKQSRSVSAKKKLTIELVFKFSFSSYLYRL
jgi:hypothetical protein